MSIVLNEDNTSLIIEKIILCAMRDFYESVIPKPEPVKRPKKKTVNGYRIMTDKEYSEYLTRRDVARVRLLNDTRRFFKSDWFKKLSKIDGDVLMQALRFRRENNLPFSPYDEPVSDDMREKEIEFSNKFKGLYLYE